MCPDAGSSAPPPILRISFAGPDRLLANEFDYWGATTVGDGVERDAAGEAAGSAQWFVTSGSLFVRDGQGWSGMPDVGPVDERSEQATGSSTFRAHTRRGDFGDIVVSTQFRLEDYVVAPGAVRHEWDGLHLMLRVQGEAELYTVSLARRDGHVALKRKLPGGPVNGGTYTSVVDVASPNPVAGDDHSARVLVRNRGPDAVEIALELDGTTVFDVVDQGSGVPALTAPGAVGIRADNLEFAIESLVVSDSSDW